MPTVGVVICLWLCVEVNASQPWPVFHFHTCEARELFGATQSVTERERSEAANPRRDASVVVCLAAPIRTIGRRKIPQVHESCAASSFHLFLAHWLDQWKSEPAGCLQSGYFVWPPRRRWVRTTLSWTMRRKVRPVSAPSELFEMLLLWVQANAVTVPPKRIRDNFTERELVSWC